MTNEAYEKDFTVKLKDRLAAEVLLATETFNKFKHENLAFSPQDYFQSMQRSVNTFGHSINEMRTGNF